MVLIDKIKGLFGKIKLKLAPVFVAVFGQDGAEQIGKAVLAGLNSALGQVVLKVVEAMMTLKIEGQDASGAQKREAAFKAIISEAKAQGLTFSTSIVNLLIELAVARLSNVMPVQQ